MNIDLSSSSSSDEDEEIQQDNQSEDQTIEHVHRYMFRATMSNGYATADEVFYAIQEFMKTNNAYECVEVSVENVELSNDGLELTGADALKSQIERDYHIFKEIEQKLKALHGIESNGLFDRFSENIAGKENPDDDYDEQEDPLGLSVNHEILAYEIDRFWGMFMETENIKSCDNRRQAYNKYRVIIEGYDYKNFERFKTDVIPLSDSRSLSFVPLDNNSGTIYHKEIDYQFTDHPKHDKKRKQILQAESIQIGVYSQGEEDTDTNVQESANDDEAQGEELKNAKRTSIQQQQQQFLFFEELYCLTSENLQSLEMYLHHRSKNHKNLELIASLKGVGQIRIVAPFSKLHQQEKQPAELFWLVPSEKLEFYLSTEIRRICNGNNNHAKWIRIPNFILSLSHSRTLAKILATQNLAFKLNQAKPPTQTSQSQKRYTNAIDSASTKYQFIDEQFTESVARALDSIQYFKVSYAILLLFARNQIKLIEIKPLCDYLSSQAYLLEEQMIPALESVYLMKKGANVVNHIQQVLQPAAKSKKSSKSEKSNSKESKKTRNQGLCEVIRLTVSASNLIFEPLALEHPSSFQKEIDITQPLLRVQISEDLAFNTLESQRTLALYYRTLLSFFKVQQQNYHYFGHSSNLSSALLLPIPQPQTPRGLQDAVEKVAQFSSIIGGATEQAFAISRVLEKSVLLKKAKLSTHEDPTAFFGTISDKEFSKISKQFPALEDFSIVLLQIQGYTCTFYPTSKITAAAYTLPKKLYTHQSKSPGVYILDYSTCQVGSLPREIALKIFPERQLDMKNQERMNKQEDFYSEYLKFQNNLIKFPLQVHFNRTITALKKMNYPFNVDPFFSSVFASMREKELQSSRVFPANCFQLFAMIDIENILKEGEVFVFLKQGKQDIQAVSGDVVLVKEGENDISAQSFKAITAEELASRNLQVDKYSSVKNIIVISKASSNFVKSDGRVTLLLSQKLDNPLVINVKNPKNMLPDEEAGQEELGLRKSLSLFSANLAQIKSTVRLTSEEQLQVEAERQNSSRSGGLYSQQQLNKYFYLPNETMEIHPIVRKLVQGVNEFLEFIESDEDFTELILQPAKNSFKLIETLDMRIKILTDKRQRTDIFGCLFAEKELLDLTAMEELQDLALLLCSELLNEVFSKSSEQERKAIYQPYDCRNSPSSNVIDPDLLISVQFRLSLFYLFLSFDLSSASADNEFLKQQSGNDNSTLRRLLRTIAGNEELKSLILNNKSKYCSSKENTNILYIQGIFWIAASHFMLYAYSQKD